MKNATTANQCLLICKETDQCQWYSFDLVTLMCITFKTCDALDEEDTDFTSGQVECSAQQFGFSKRAKQ